jgi:excisionase family DNA binding protein
MSPRIWLTVGDAAAQTRKSTRTIGRWIILGKLPAHRDPGGFGVLIDQADLDRLFQRIPAADGR